MSTHVTRFGTDGDRGGLSARYMSTHVARWTGIPNVFGGEKLPFSPFETLKKWLLVKEFFPDSNRFKVLEV